MLRVQNFEKVTGKDCAVIHQKLFNHVHNVSYLLVYWASFKVLFVDCKTSNIPKLSNSWLSCHVMSVPRVSQLVHCAQDLKGVYMYLSVRMYVCKFLHESMSTCMHVYMFVCLCVKIDLKYFATVSIRMSVSECMYECSACLLTTYRIRLNKFEGPYYCGRD